MGKFFVNVINNFESKENNIKNILTCLDKLKDITEEVFYSINKSLSDKIERFNNLKLRIVRINKIIEILNSIIHNNSQFNLYIRSLSPNFHTNFLLHNYL